MKQHILVVSQYFYPEEFRVNNICAEWVKRGYKVTVVTGIPNYPQGKFYKGYGWFRGRREEWKGVHILRIPLIPRGKSALMMAFNYFSFVVSGFFWKTFTGIKADKVFIFEVSPMTQALVGVWYARRRKIPCYIYVQDLWPENVEIVTGIRNRAIIGVIDKMVDYIYRNCTGIFATSPSFVKRIEERDSAWAGGRRKDGSSKVLYYPQYAEEFYRPVARQPLEDVEEDGRFKIVFTGNIGYAQGLDILPKIAKALKERQIDCVFYVIGDGRYRSELERVICEEQICDRFRFLGRKKPEQIPGYLAHCDMGFLSFANNPLFSMTIPAKLQSYMACGIPILAVAGGETARIIREADCGAVCDFENINGIVEIIAGLCREPEKLQKMGENARRYSEEHFDSEELLDRLCDYMNLRESGK